MTRRLRVFFGLVAVLLVGAIAPAASAAAVIPGSTYDYDNAAVVISTAQITASSYTTRPASLRVATLDARPGPTTVPRSSAAPYSSRRAAKAVRPAVTDARLGRALGDDFRGGPNPIGDGSALDAARHTVTTGDLVGGSTHLEKVVEMRDRYARIIRRGGLNSADEAVARSRYDAYRGFAQEHDLDAMMSARGLR